MEAKYYTDLKLPIQTFATILKTGDHSLLYIDEKGNEDLSDVWFKIYNDYCREAKISNRHIKQMGKIEDLKRKYKDIKLLLEFLNCEFPKVIIKAKEVLKKKYGYLVRNGQPISSEIERLNKKLDAFHTKIKIEENKLPKEQKQEGISIIKESAILENVFGGNKSIDVYTTSTEKWIALKELAKEISAERKKVLQQNKR